MLPNFYWVTNWLSDCVRNFSWGGPPDVLFDATLALPPGWSIHLIPYPHIKIFLITPKRCIRLAIDFPTLFVSVSVYIHVEILTASAADEAWYYLRSSTCCVRQKISRSENGSTQWCSLPAKWVYIVVSAFAVSRNSFFLCVYVCAK